MSEKNITSQVAVMIDKALEAIIDQWYQSVREYYITTEKKIENPDIFGPEELKRFHDETGHRIKFSKADLDFTYGLSLIDDDEGYSLDVSVNNKVPNFNYSELGNRLTAYYQTNSEKPVEGFSKLKKIRNCDAFPLKDYAGRSILVEEREGKADIVRMTFRISEEYLHDLVAEPGSFMELIQQYCVAPLRRIYAEVYRIKRR